MSETKPAGDTSRTTIFPGRTVHTLDPARPIASAVAVRDSRFLAVGDTDELVATYGGTIDDTELVHGLVFTQKASHAAGGPSKVVNAKIGLIQFCLSAPKTDIEQNVVVSDYSQMDRILKEERKYILDMCKKIQKSGCNVLLIQKSILRDAVNDAALPADLRPGAQRDRDAAEATAAVAVTAPPGAPVPWYAPPPAETADPADDEAIEAAQAALWSKKDARKAAGILRRAVAGAERAPAALLAFLYGVEALALRADAAEASQVLARARRAAGRDPALGDCACCGAAMRVDAPAADRPFVLACGHCFHAPCLAGFCAKQQGECPSCGKPADAEDVACLWLWAFGDRAARGEPLSDAQRALANELCDAGLAKRIQPPSSSS